MNPKSSEESIYSDFWTLISLNLECTLLGTNEVYLLTLALTLTALSNMVKYIKIYIYILQKQTTFQTKEQANSSGDTRNSNKSCKSCSKTTNADEKATYVDFRSDFFSL